MRRLTAARIDLMDPLEVPLGIINATIQTGEQRE
jgi:hypothetical protein